ncbi:hypothetical protein ACRZ5S_06980 [Vibrio scophthalmi]|uniref:hypothetical protein n=1 Tax=Vibrio scophthalmi TaxID=45658 RepID=UPI003EB808A7
MAKRRVAKPKRNTRHGKAHKEKTTQKPKGVFAILSQYWKQISITIGLCFITYAGFYFFNSPINKIERMTFSDMNKSYIKFYFDNYPYKLNPDINLDLKLDLDNANYDKKFGISKDMTWAKAIKNSPLIKDYNVRIFRDREAYVDDKIISVTKVEFTFSEKARDVYYIQYFELYSPLDLPVGYKIFDVYGFLTYPQTDSDTRTKLDIHPFDVLTQFSTGHLDKYDDLDN